MSFWLKPLTAAVLTLGAVTLAQAVTPAERQAQRVDHRQARQAARIDQGVASGQLNKREAARLQARENKLAAHETGAKADGVVTKKERVRLNKEANRDSKAILKQKHDRQKAKS